MNIRLICLVMVLPLSSLMAGDAQTDPDSSGMLRPFRMAIYVANASQSAEWYQTHLGFRVTHRMDFPNLDSLRIVFLRRDAAELELIQKRSSFPITKYVHDYDQEKAPVLGLTKVGFWVENVAALADRFRREGVRILYGPFDDEAFREKSVIIEDLEGNLLQFSEPMGEQTPGK